MAAKTPLWAIGIVVLCSFVITAAQVLVKIALNSGSAPLLILGIGLVGLGGVLMLLAFKHGELSVLHPLLSLSFIWVLIGSAWLGETLSWHHYGGVGSIVFGVILIGRSRGAA